MAYFICYINKRVWTQEFELKSLNSRVCTQEFELKRQSIEFSIILQNWNHCIALFTKTGILWKNVVSRWLAVIYQFNSSHIYNCKCVIVDSLYENQTRRTDYATLSVYD